MQWDDTKIYFGVFPLAKIVQFRKKITLFVQLENETFYGAWEIFKELLRKYPYHGIQPWVQIQTFCNGLIGQTKSIIDATARGSQMMKT